VAGGDGAAAKVVKEDRAECGFRVLFSDWAGAIADWKCARPAVAGGRSQPHRRCQKNAAGGARPRLALALHSDVKVFDFDGNRQGMAMRPDNRSSLMYRPLLPKCLAQFQTSTSAPGAVGGSTSWSTRQYARAGAAVGRNSAGSGVRMASFAGLRFSGAKDRPASLAMMDSRNLCGWPSQVPFESRTTTPAACSSSLFVRTNFENACSLPLTAN